MGYACPVCETPQADARHLANHLAFTALLGDDDHEAWLDEHVPEWEQAGETALAERVVENAAEVEFPQVFEDTTGHDHDHGDEPRPGDLFEEESRSQPRGLSSSNQDLDTETAEAIERARELTREAREPDTEQSGDDTESDADENE